MTIYFGLALDDPAQPLPHQGQGGVHYLGPQGMLFTLEAHLGLLGHPPENEYLRIEQYRQVLQAYLRDRSGAFFQTSFEADQFATATELISRRDELLLSGWYFEADDRTPPRLRVLADLEMMLQTSDRSLAPGFADRFTAVLHQLGIREQPFTDLYINEPLAFLPVHWQTLLQKLKQTGVQLHQLPAPEILGESDLATFQRALTSERVQAKLQQDGSLLILRGKRETDLAGYLAKLFRRNPGFQPLCLIPEKNRALDYALVQEGLPGMGIPSASLARPTLQVLKLVTVFLWNPIDPFKIMEFVSLAIKPLEEELSNRIAAQMAQAPGLNSDSWYAMTARYFEEMERRAAQDSSIDLEEIRYQYRFWFERRRYDIAGAVPKEDVIQVFAYLHRWARRQFEETSSKTNSLLMLSEQAKRIADLLEQLPETQLSNLELERIVRTIYEPTPVHFQEQELGHLLHIHQPNAILGDVRDLLWFNFCQNEPAHFFSRWYETERRFLAECNVRLRTPEDENTLLIWQRSQPVLHAQERLILTMPETVNGSPVNLHPLYGNLEATFGKLSAITLDVDADHVPSVFAEHFELPQQVQLRHRRLGTPRPFIQLSSPANFAERDEETFSSLESLFYYPYQWVFRHKIKLKKSSILSVVQDHTLMGNLAHRFFERLFKQDIRQFSKPQVERWIDEESNRLLRREGAVLLMYGREPERIAFVKKVKFAAWSLIHLIQNNGWRVADTEKALAGKFLGIPVNGRADLVLEKDGEMAVIDLKWRGARRREETIRNEADLQLVLYSKLLTDDHQWAHTAYFIMERGQLLARNNQAFREVNAIAPDTDWMDAHRRILDKMQATFQWRMQQIKEGRVEVRCRQTWETLEEIHGSELLELLEMKSDDAPFDDYRTLINLIE